MYQQWEKLETAIGRPYFLHISSQYGELRPTSSKFEASQQRVLRLGFVNALMSLNGGQPNFARCLAISWAGTLYKHFPQLLSLDGILPGVKFTLRPSFTFSHIGSTTAWHSSSVHQPNFAPFSRGRHLYSARRPLCWASNYILFFLFLLAYSQRSQTGCLPCFHTWCGLSVNLECRSEMCCTRLTKNTGCKNSPSGHHRTTLSGYVFATKACIDNRKKIVEQQYFFHLS